MKSNSENQHRASMCLVKEDALKNNSHFSRIIFLIKDSVLYGIAIAISRAFALISFPILARHLSLSEFGSMDYFVVLGGLLTTILIFGQDSAVARYFYEYDDHEIRCQIISQSLLFQFFWVSIVLPVLFLCADSLTESMSSVTNRISLFKIVLLQIPFLLLINFSQNLLKWTFSRRKFLIMSLGFGAVQAILVTLAVTSLHVNLEGILFANLLSSIFFGLLGLFYVRRWLVVSIDFRYLGDLVKFAIPFGVICLLNASVPVFERSLTSSLLGINELGLYAAAAKISLLISLLVGAFQTAWGPFSLSLYKYESAGQTYNLVFKLFAYVSCMAALMITLVAQPLIHFLATEKFDGSVVVVFPLVMGLTIQSIGWITEVGISISKRSFLNIYPYTVATISTVVGILFLAPIMGLLGVGVGILLGHILKTSVSYWLAQRAYPLAWEYKPVLNIVALTMTGGGLSIWTNATYGIAASNYVIGLSLIFELIIGWIVLFNQNERARLASILKGLSSKLMLRGG